jgi:hypothetical protein
LNQKKKETIPIDTTHRDISRRIPTNLKIIDEDISNYFMEEEIGFS